jgi:hypothetical protein
MSVKFDIKEFEKELITKVNNEVINEAKKKGLKAELTNGQIKISGDETKVKKFINKIKK